jgi:hypothetical protein
MYKQKLITAAAIAATFVLSFNAIAFDGKDKRQAGFKVRIENTSDKGGLTAQDGSRYPFAVSPGIYVVTKNNTDFFKVGKKASSALETQAEDGDPGLFSASLPAVEGISRTGIFNTPVGGGMPSPLLPGGVFEFTFNASVGMKLNLVAMFGQSNDLFYAPEKAISLFDAQGNPVTGDITQSFQLWDAGTEVNQAPGIGPDQAPRQKARNTGAAEKGVVRLVNDGFTYPVTKDVLRITITAQ